jgi:hypothetical protein
MQRPRRGVGKRAGGLIIGRCFFVASGLGFAGAGAARAGVNTLFSGAGGVMIGTLDFGVIGGSGDDSGRAVARFKILAIWMYALVKLEL